MSGPACVIPVQSIELYEAAHQKRWEEAAELQKKQWPLNVAFQRFSLAACIKAGLEMQGFPVGQPLPPRSSWTPKGGAHWKAFSGASELYERRLT